MKITAEPRSDQLNADDFVGRSETYTVAGVIPGKAEQKYDIQLVETDRAWRPPLTVLRLLIAAWGDDATAWVGKRATLYCDETVRFGRDTVGGIRVSHLSHINGPMTVKLTASRGKRATVTVQPLAAPEPPPDYMSAVNDATTEDELRALWNQAKDAGHMNAALDTAIKDRRNDITAADVPAQPEDDA